MKIRWTYLCTEYTAGRISGGYGVTNGEGRLVYSHASLAVVIQAARDQYGYDR